MKVALHAGQLLQPVPGGIGRYERALLANLGAAGVEAVAFAAGRRPANLAPTVPWVDLGFPHGSLRYELWHRLRQPVVRLDADLVHAPSLAVPPTGSTPLVVTVHDVAFLRYPRLTTRRGVRFHTRGLELARRHASQVVAISEFTRAELIREGFDAGRVAVAYSGVDPPAPRDDAEIAATIAGAGVEQPFVLSVGTIEPRKDLPTAVAAVAQVRAHGHGDLTHVLVGPPGWGEVTGLDRPFVRRLGACPWHVLDALYRSAAVVCLPSRYEGFGLPVVEALARNAPVVTTSGSSLEEIAGDAGILFAPGDVDACADALRQVLDDDTSRARLTALGRRRAAEFTWTATVAAYARAYSAAMSRS